MKVIVMNKSEIVWQLLDIAGVSYAETFEDKTIKFRELDSTNQIIRLIMDLMLPPVDKLPVEHIPKPNNFVFEIEQRNNKQAFYRKEFYYDVLTCVANIAGDLLQHNEFTEESIKEKEEVMWKLTYWEETLKKYGEEQYLNNQ